MGGSPLFNRELHVGCPEIGNRNHFFERVNDIFNRRRLTNNGQYVREFEEKIAKFTGAKYCIAVCNGTVGLELVIRALGLEGEVILPSLTFVATAHALLWQGIKPVFCDVDPETFCIEPREVERMISPKTSGIIGVHLFGRVCEVERLQSIADEHGLKLLFDAAHAFGCTKIGKSVGSFGCAEVFSFHATKVVNCFEGGAVLTNDDYLADKLRVIRNFGFKDLDTVSALGVNAKMSEVSAAMGLTSLEGFEDVVTINKKNYVLYKKLLAGISGISMFQYDLQEKNNFQYIVLSIDDEISGISRDNLLKVLRTENILARRYFFPGCHRMEPYCSMFTDFDSSLPITDRINNQLIQLPTGSTVGPQDIEKICGLIHFCSRNSQGIWKV
jgi:dTDP-4-amino-4,6-dideoxygalactose transaminase